LISFFNCGYVARDGLTKYKYIVSAFGDINDVIIPFFQQYPLQSQKRLDYLDWCSVASLMREGEHLTPEGLDKIRAIKAGMN
jgi:hypothetical protein